MLPGNGTEEKRGRTNRGGLPPAPQATLHAASSPKNHSSAPHPQAQRPQSSPPIPKGHTPHSPRKHHTPHAQRLKPQRPQRTPQPRWPTRRGDNPSPSASTLTQQAGLSTTCAPRRIPYAHRTMPQSFARQPPNHNHPHPSPWHTSCATSPTPHAARPTTPQMPPATQSAQRRRPLPDLRRRTRPIDTCLIDRMVRLAAFLVWLRQLSACMKYGPAWSAGYAG